MRKLATSIAVGGLVLMCGAPAGAASAPTPYADVVGNVRITSPTTAEVRARYLCHDADALWVSVKQGGDPSSSHAGFGGAASTWSQSHSMTGLVCDGKTHVSTFSVHQEEQGAAGPIGRGTLLKGEPAWVQFCITPAGGSHDDVISSMEFVQAR